MAVELLQIKLKSLQEKVVIVKQNYVFKGFTIEGDFDLEFFNIGTKKLQLF